LQLLRCKKEEYKKGIDIVKTIFLNCSPNKNASTYRIGEEVLKEIEHEILQMSDYKICQYGQVCEDDQISEIFKRFE